MEKANLYLILNDDIITRYKEHLDEVGYDKNKLFEKIIIDFLKRNDKIS
jgi:hypothetical protein